jgi:phage protein D
MPVTSGARTITAFLRVDGTPMPVESLSVTLPAERKSATWEATTAVSALPAGLGESYWASQSPQSIDCVVSINGTETVLMSGILDTAEAPLHETKIHFTGRCKSAALHHTKSREKWTNKKPEEIIKDLAGRVGLSADIDSYGIKAGRFAQIDWAEIAHGHSYAEVIHKYADLIGARWWVDGSTLHIHTDPQSGVYDVNYVRGAPDVSDAKSVTVTRNFHAAKPAEVTTHGWDSRQKKVVKSKSTVSGTGDTIVYTHEHHGISPEHAAKHAKGKAKEHARNEFTAHIELVGDTSLARAVKLNLTGNAWAAAYEIDSITHHVQTGSGFTSSISCKGPKTGRTPS